MENDPPQKILYCRCAFAQVVPQATKDGVLERLCGSSVDFESVSDLCEMSARRDPRLKELADQDDPPVIVACFPRAVKWLFHQAEAPLPNDVSVLNMREESVDEIAGELGI